MNEKEGDHCPKCKAGTLDPYIYLGVIIDPLGLSFDFSETHWWQRYWNNFSCLSSVYLECEVCNLIIKIGEKDD